MNIFFWKNNKKLDEFSLSLAEEFIERFPNDAEHSIPNKKNKIKLDKVLTNIHNRAIQYKKDNAPGFYARAKIGNTFMWALKDREYNEEFVNKLTNDLLKLLGGKK